jgi:TP901 family phage tail tape measure protein
MAVATMKVPTIFVAIDRFSDVVDKMTRKTTMFGSAASAAAMRTSSKFNAAGTSLLSSGAVMGVGIGLAVNEAVKFEKAMATVSTTIDSTPELMKKMGNEVLALSKIIPKPTEDLTSALYDVVSAGIEASHSMTVLKASGRLAVAGLGTTAEGVDILTSSINSFNIDASKSEEIANKVFKAVKYGKTTVEGLSESFGNSSALIKNSNIELSEFLATTAALTTTGMSASRAQTQVASATIALIKPNKTMSKILAQLGAKDVPTFIKKSGGLVKTLALVQKQAAKTGANLPAALGRKEGLNALLSLLGPLRSKYNEIYEDMVNGNDTLSESFKKQTATSSARFQILKNNLVDLGIKVGDAVLPALNSLMSKVSPIIEGITKWSQNNQWLSKTLFNVTGLLLGLGVAAKVTGAIFYGYGKILAFVNGIQKAYVFITEYMAFAALAAASGQATFAASLWATATALLAAYWPVLLVVAALGGLAYVMSSTESSTDSYVNTQLAGLSKSNMAWQNSTSVMKGELAKQSAAMKKPQTLEMSANKINSKYDGIALLNKKADYATNATKENNALRLAGKPSYSDDALKYAIKTNSYQFETPQPKNLAGQSQYKANTDGSAQAGGEVTIRILSDNEKLYDVENKNPKGINVVTTSTKK